MKTPHLLSCFLCSLTMHVFGQGSLTPPGAAAPTMKTLDQIEPRKEVNATNTPGDGTSVFRITVPGSYYLSTNVTGVASKNGISIQADNVTLDLNGFVLNGTVSNPLAGIIVSGSHANIAIRNGTVTGWGPRGIDAESANNSQFANLRISDNAGTGITVGGRCSVSDCVIKGNIANGLWVTNGVQGCIIRDCVANSSLNGDGIRDEGNGSLIMNCNARSNGSNGIFNGGGGRTTIAGCNFTANGASGINATSGNSCYFLNNNCGGNTDAGIAVVTNSNRIEGNVTRGNQIGIIVFGGTTNNLIVRNSAGGNSGNNYDIGAGNRYGPIVDDTANDPASAPAAVGNSAVGDLNTTSPWANFAH
jgi:hypothetical protein